MRTETITVRDQDGVKTGAELCLCDCGSDQFVIFELAGQDHPHFQCSHCGTSFCSRGECQGRERRSV